MINKEEVKRLVNKALDCQFEGYSWDNMIDDIELTLDEKAWAKEHLTCKVEEV